MNCRQFIELLDDFVAAAQPPHDRDGSEEHLALCPYCRDYLKTYCDTIELLKAALAGQPDARVPDEVAAALADTVRRACAERPRS